MKRLGHARYVGILAAAACLTWGVSAQQQVPTFRTGVTLVTVDVSVFDDDGKPVPGLEAGDFEVKLNGKTRPVRVLSYVQAAGELAPGQAAVVPELAPAPEGTRQGRQVVTNAGVTAAQKQAGEDRVFVLLIDDLSFAPLRGKALFLSAKRFITELPAIDLVGLAFTSGSGAVNPTLDRARVLDVLSKAGGEAGDPQTLSPVGSDTVEEPDADGVVGIYQAMEIEAGNNEVLKQAITDSCFNGDRTEVDSQVIEVLISENTCASQVQRQARTTAAVVRQTTRRQVGSYKATIEAMQQATGIKHLMVLTDGVAVGRDADQVMPMARAAAAAGVQVSFLMEERDMSLGDQARRKGPESRTYETPDPGAPSRRIEDNRMFLQGAQTTADMAGGQFYRIIGDPEPFFDRVRTASSAVYRLGIEPQVDLDPTGNVRVEAKVNRRGVHVFANRNGVAPAAAALAAAEPTVDDRLMAAISRGQSHGAVPLSVATALRRSASGSALDLSINAEVPSTVRGPLVAMFGLTRIPAPGEALAAMTSGRKEIPTAAEDGTYTLSVSLPAEEGSYLLRVAVADAEGALGALEVPVEATLTAMGPFVASDLLTAWVDAAGQPHLMAFNDLPAAATSLQTLLELYAPAGGASSVLEALQGNVQVEFSLTRIGAADPVDERIVAPQFSNGVLRTSVEFATDALESGTYRVRVTVRVGDEVAGTAIATVRKS